MGGVKWRLQTDWVRKQWDYCKLSPTHLHGENNSPPWDLRS